MPALHHHCLTRKLGPEHPLFGKTIYLPAMAEGSVEALASVFRWLGIEARPTPPSDSRTLELGARYTSGDECYPAQITVGDFLRVTEQPGFNPKKTVFFMATGNGPCRFGQYALYLRKLLCDLNYGDLPIVCPTTDHGYSEIGEFGTAFIRTAWRALVASDLLHKRLLQTRPYESVPGAADQAFRESIADLCRTIESSCSTADCQMRALLPCLERARQRFRAVPARYEVQRPLIGIVGEIFCRHNTFSNDDLIRRLERQGAECWLCDIAEWIGYCNAEEVRKLKLQGRTALSWEVAKSKLRDHVQHKDEHTLGGVFQDDFRGYEESAIDELMELARPYLPNDGVEGEMVMSMGKCAHYAMHGADGVVDISPFTCMNGIVSEALYPSLSRDYAGIPIRNFYFDGTQSDLDRDLGIYLELARSYRNTKPYTRVYPDRFHQPAA